MPAVQTSYSATQRAAVAGMPASTTGYDADSKSCETAAGIGFGLAVSKGSADRGVVIGGAAFCGVTQRDVTLIHPAATLDKFIQYEQLSVMVRGDIWVAVGDAVVAGGPVQYDPTTGVLGAAVGTQLHGCRWMTTQATPGGLAVLRLGNAASPPVVYTPFNETLPTISGTAQVGQTLTGVAGTWGGSPTFTYKWKADGVAVVGQTALTIVLAEAQLGTNMTFEVTATNANGSAVATSAETADVIAD